jgi:CRISPR-associated protein (TIGR03986 family)
MQKITAPYNFAPLNAAVFFPEWGEQATQDWPFKDGLCGTLEYEIEALGPVFVRGDEVQVNGKPAQEFFRSADGRYAIPGSSVRGLLRNVVQIASFGKFAPVNNHRYGIRDLHNPGLYGNHMGTIDPSAGKGSAALVPLVSAGWLRIETEIDEQTRADEVVATIVPCSFAKIEYGLLEQLSPGFRPGMKQSAPDKYRAWKRSREVWVRLGEPKGTAVRRAKGALGDFTIVAGLDGDTKGTLVFTGQPQNWDPGQVQRRGGGKPKHHDFVFYGPRLAPVPVTKQRFMEFEFIHSDRGQQGRTRAAPNEEWGYWRKEYAQGREVPVFFLMEPSGELRSFGLAMMFRLAYLHSVGEIADANQEQRNAARLDLAETLFGRVAQGHDREEASLKGRVSVGLATLVAGQELSGVIEAVLGAPKASFYPSYVEQGANPLAEPGAQPASVGGKPRFRTFQDADARLRGWKRYRPQEAQLKPALPEGASDKVKSRFRPLGKGARFRGRIRVHNVRPVELGALLWAIDFGGDQQAEHMLGMARSLGYGRVRLRVTKVELEANDGGAVRGDDVLAECVRSFEQWAEAQAAAARVPGGWKGSAQVALLVGCARPLPPGSSDGLHMSLKHPEDRNQFARAKQEGLALAPATPWRAPAGTAPAPTRRAGAAARAPGAPRAGAAPAAPSAPAKAPPPGPVELVVPELAFNPGAQEWTGAAQLEGKPIRIVGKGKALPGLTPKQTDKRQAKQVRCRLERIGGNVYRVVEILPGG